MDLIEMYPAAVNSKVTVTLGVLNADSTIIEVLDGSVLPDAPTLLVLGSDQTAETVKLTAKEGNTLTVERGIQGNAIAWPAGTQIARNFTAKDWDDLVANVATIVAKIMGLSAADVHARPDTWMPTASDVGAVAQFNNTPDYIIEDATYPTAYVCSINGRDYMPNTGYFRILYLPYFAYEQGYAVQVAFGAVGNDGLWFRKANGETWENWKQVMQADGSVPMSGWLTVPNVINISDGYIKSWKNGELILGLKDRAGSDDTFRALAIMDTGKHSNVATALRFLNVTNGSYAGGDFAVYGEHNKELLSGTEYPLTITETGLASVNGNISRYWVDADGTAHVIVSVKSVDSAVSVTSGALIIGNLPVGFRPKNEVRTSAVKVDSSAVYSSANLFVLPNGNIGVWMQGNVTWLHGTLTFKAAN